MSEPLQLNLEEYVKYQDRPEVCEAVTRRIELNRQLGEMLVANTSSQMPPEFYEWVEEVNIVNGQLRQQGVDTNTLFRPRVMRPASYVFEEDVDDDFIDGPLAA
jgi:hypothetical protein